MANRSIFFSEALVGELSVEESSFIVFYQEKNELRV